jgi:serine/threonine protein kinase
MTFIVVKTFSKSRCATTELVKNPEDGMLFVRKTILRTSYRGAEELVRTTLGNKYPGIQKLDHVKYGLHYVRLFFEYVDGEDFFDFVEQKGNLTESESRNYFRQLVEIVNHCHQNGIVHRDLKLENIVIDPETHKLTIIDWNFASSWDPNRLLHLSCGSPKYAAPELFQRQSYRGPEVDIYALGVILFSMVVGDMPNWVERGDKGVGFRIVNSTITYPNTMNPELKRLLQGMLERDAKNRWTMAQIRKSKWLTAYHHVKTSVHNKN